MGKWKKEEGLDKLCMDLNPTAGDQDQMDASLVFEYELLVIFLGWLFADLLQPDISRK